MKLSIITPYYKTLDETKRLAEVLTPQLTEDTEWIIIDDGTDEKELDKLKARVIHLKENSGAAGKPRNIGLDNATGDYIAFIDSDDLVSDDYIENILKAIKGIPDVVYLGWESRTGNMRVIGRLPKWNCAVWCRVYKKETIGYARFDEKLKLAEDWVFNESISYNSACYVRKIVYYYNNKREGSLTNG